ncbi:MAG TPA: hypothetical protein VM537_06775 [Anaerolineae bacterium]|nr:hypothetical protein [Anaerolineae bacterium]
MDGKTDTLCEESKYPPADELAKAMHDGLSGFDPAVRNPRWDELPGWVHESYRRQARAALDYLGIAPEAAEAGWDRGIKRVEKHLGQWGRGLRLTEDEQRDVHLVALGALLMLCPGGDRERMTRIHRACGCIVCRAEAKAKREMGEEVDGG